MVLVTHRPITRPTRSLRSSNDINKRCDSVRFSHKTCRVSNVAQTHKASFWTATSQTLGNAQHTLSAAPLAPPQDRLADILARPGPVPASLVQSVTILSKSSNRLCIDARPQNASFRARGMTRRRRRRRRRTRKQRLEQWDA